MPQAARPSPGREEDDVSIGRLGSVAAVVLALGAPAARADSVRCAGGIVQTGDAKLDLLAKCGRPSLVEGAFSEVGTFEALNGVGRRVYAPVDVWTYDFGRNQFVQRVRLVNGRIVSIERGGYGYADEQPWRGRPPRSSCDPATLSVGKLTLEILSRCGEPAVKDTWAEDVAAVTEVAGIVYSAGTVTRTIALWTYDFGPNQLVRFVRLEDGKVTRVETGSYGYGQ
jgi:hypothetical protein